jgi:DNA invertase Pin-like site-specific DNA recombinase
MGEIVGYARTSTLDQAAGLADQEAELRSAGVTTLYSEKVSGADTERPQLQEALRFLRKGDTFVVTKPDRLARSTVDLLTIVQGLTKRDVTVRLLSMGIDTATATGKLLLTMLAGVAEFERALMLERQRAGIAAAKAAGRYKGRVPTARRKTDEVLRLKSEGLGMNEVAQRAGVSRASAYRIVKSADASS